MKLQGRKARMVVDCGPLLPQSSAMYSVLEAWLYVRMRAFSGGHEDVTGSCCISPYLARGYGCLLPRTSMRRRCVEDCEAPPSPLDWIKTQQLLRP